MNAPVYFNGIDGATGGYLRPPVALAEVAHRLQGFRPDEETEAARFVPRRVRAGLDASDLAQAGWGVVFSPDTPPEVFVTNLARMLLARGAHAVIGHVDQSLDTSFVWSGTGARHGLRKCALAECGRRKVGDALEVFEPWAEIATDLSEALIDAKKAWLWLAHNDARGYIAGRPCGEDHFQTIVAWQAGLSTLEAINSRSMWIDRRFSIKCSPRHANFGADGYLWTADRQDDSSARHLPRDILRFCHDLRQLRDI